MDSQDWLRLVIVTILAKSLVQRVNPKIVNVRMPAVQKGINVKNALRIKKTKLPKHTEKMWIELKTQARV